MLGMRTTMAETISLEDSGTVATRWWHRRNDGRVECDVCPRACKLREGQRGVCFVRGRVDDQIVLTSYGRCTGLCIDPIEKKPLFHFLPGSPVLSFGTAGCNLACRFCQNWDVTKSKQTDRRAQRALPSDIAATAARLGCDSVAFTYNDPVVFMEYAVDTARECRRRGIATVGVTAGYIRPGPRAVLFESLDAANIDLKAFSEDFYRHVAMGSLQEVLETIEWVHATGRTWLELTTLLIPEHNDSDGEIAELCTWIAEHLGADVPLHFTAFHPDFRMRNVPPTPPATLRRARNIARAHGLRHVYTGNIHDAEGQTTWCTACGDPLIERSWHCVAAYRLTPEGACPSCGTIVPGVFAPDGGQWNGRRVPVPGTEVAS
jgi:pyruvate formate lyase activating enzyme